MTSYGYFSSKTLAESWDTKAIETFIFNYGCFKNPSLGNFKHCDVYFSMHLAYADVGISSDVYDERKTNYIDVIMASYHPLISEILKTFEDFLGVKFISDEDDEYWG